MRILVVDRTGKYGPALKEAIRSLIPSLPDAQIAVTQQAPNLAAPSIRLIALGPEECTDLPTTIQQLKQLGIHPPTMLYLLAPYPDQWEQVEQSAEQVIGPGQFFVTRCTEISPHQISAEFVAGALA